MSKSNLITVASVAHKLFGPAEFHRMAAQLWEGKSHLSWDDWDEFFELAVETGCTSGHYDKRDQWVPQYPELARLLVLQRRRVMAGKATGQTAWQFHSGEKARIEAEEEDFRRKQREIESQKRLVVEARGRDDAEKRKMGGPRVKVRSYFGGNV
jgi:hypothetical protein